MEVGPLCYKMENKMSTDAPLGIFLASHEADTGMKSWDLARWTQEVQELKRMGANTVW